MNIFDVLNLFGGLALFLFGMRFMGDGLKESSSGTLKIAMESVTNNPFKAFLLGVIVTAIIQSSTATIVITSGLVAAGIITLRQSIGILVGANVGTTVTGQIIRLLDVNSTGWLQIFKPSTLAPVALIIGIIFIMGLKYKNAKTIGNILVGFGILFTGLLNMTNAVNALGETGIFESLFSQLGSNPLLGYLTGAGVAFLLQSSSATIGILQALSSGGQLHFYQIYAVIVGVYLGDCVTTSIVCSIGAKPDAKRVGIINILFNLSKMVLVLTVVAILKKMGFLDWIWNATMNSGLIANTNTIFNLACAIVLFPFLTLFEKASYKIVKDEPVAANKYQEKIDALSPAFFNTPALALRSAYDALLTIFYAGKNNTNEAFNLLSQYDDHKWESIQAEEDNIDLLTDSATNYLAQVSAHLVSDEHIAILNQYYKVVDQFERLGDYAMNIAETAKEMHDKNTAFSEYALNELSLIHELINTILDYTETTFRDRNVDAAFHIEPLEEVVDDLVYSMKENHLTRLANGQCTVIAGTDFLDVLSDIERISDICSNVGFATIARVRPELANQPHDYAYFLHSGEDEKFNKEYHKAHDYYFEQLNKITSNGN